MNHINPDQHPQRYSRLRGLIEEILVRRLFENRLDGYTLETALQIIDTMKGEGHYESQG